MSTKAPLYPRRGEPARFEPAPKAPFWTVREGFAPVRWLSSIPVQVLARMRARARQTIVMILSIALGMSFGTLLVAGAGYLDTCRPRVQSVSAMSETVMLCPPSDGQCSSGPVSTYEILGDKFTIQTYASCGNALAWGIHGTVLEPNGTTSPFQLEEGAPPEVWLNWTSADGSVSVDWQGGYGWNLMLEVRA